MINLLNQIIALMFFIASAFLIFIFVIFTSIIGLITMLFNRPRIKAYHQQQNTPSDLFNEIEEDQDAIEVDYKIDKE